MADRDLYALLDVGRSASAEEIKKAYRKLARELHPDRNPGDSAAEDRFKQVSYAYEVLSDPDTRARYDEFGEVGLKEGFDPEAFRQYRAWQQAGGGRPRAGGRAGRAGDLEDLFGGGQGGAFFDLGDMLGGSGGIGELFGRRGRAARRGPDLETQLRVGFADALRGVERELSFTVPGAPDGVHTVRARIPAGVRDGGRVRLRGQGGAPSGEGGERGDLVLTVHVDEHPYFWREGDDLHVRLPVTAMEAFGGAKVRVPTLDGEVSLTIPAHTVSGAKLRLRGKGAKRGAARGDLYAHVEIALPEDDGERVVKLLEELEGCYEGSPRARLHL